MSHRIPTGAGAQAQRLAALLLATVLSLSLQGCGDAPTAPETTAVVSGPPLLVIGADGATSYERLTVAAATDTVAAGSRALKVSKEIVGPLGGWVRCGRFFLAITPGAFDSVGTVTMSMPDSTLMIVDLEIAPARLNGFHAPVYLAANTTDTDVPSDSLAIYWMDPKSGAWTDVTTTKTVTSATDCVTEVEGGVSGGDTPDSNWARAGVTSTLQHFSRYSTGKAGW
jgi:hypothetical protein